MAVYLIRHGQSEANVAKIIQGTLDSPLTETGKEQAQMLGEFLPRTLHIIYSSPLSRALETAMLATGIERNDPTLRIDHRLSEIHFGNLQGDKYIDFPADREDIIQHIHFKKDSLQGKFGAELVLDFLGRTHEVFEEIVTEYKAHQDWNIAVFSHGGVLRSISQHYLRLSEERWRNCEYGVLSLHQGKWKLERFYDHIGQ